MAAPYLITGAAVGVNSRDEVPFRYEITDLESQHSEQFTLFVLAWEKIREPTFRPEAAQFQHIAGIHGMPYAPWIGDPDEAMQTDRGAWLGYCNHASIMFPNWHRPYIMLLEQIISDVAYGIAGEYASTSGVTADQRLLWLKAAKELRFPYWDWTRESTGSKGIPEIFQKKQVTILDPRMNKVQRTNPLAYYKFTQSVDGFNNRMEITEWQNLPPDQPPPEAMAYFKQWDRTYRRPNSSPTAVTEDYGALNADLVNKEYPFQKGSWAQLTNDVANMFAFPVNIDPTLYANAWDQFSNTTFQSGRPQFVNDKAIYHSPYNWHATSLEQPHNRVHLIVGGLGHMGDNDTAGFDPIFFLHHCNVDRLLSFWEYVYPDYAAGTDGYLDVDGGTRVPFTQGGGTYIETSDQVVNAETALMPFRKGDYTYWNSKDTHSLAWVDPNTSALSWSNKNYTYEPIGKYVDINRKEPPTIEERHWMQGFLQRYFRFDPITIITGPGPASKRLPSFEAPPSHGRPSIPLGPGPELSHTKVDGYRHFIVEASLSPKYHTGSYTLNITVEIEQQSIVIGSISVLGRGNSARCGNCQAQRATDARVRGVVQIPHEILTELVDPRPMPPVLSAEAIDHQIPVYGSPEAKTLVKNVLVTLGSHVVLPSGTQHGQLSKDFENHGHSPDVHDATAPGLRVFSSDVYRLETAENQENAPFSFHNWQDHGTPFGIWSRKN